MIMPRAKSKQTLIPIDDADYEDIENEFDEDDALDKATDSQKKTFNFVEAMSGKDEAGIGTVKVMFLPEDGTQAENVANFEMDKFESYDHMIDYIEQNYGAGSYSIQAKVPNEQGKIVIAGRKRITIKKKVKVKESQAHLNENNAFSEVVTLMREQQKEMRDVLEKTNKGFDLKEMLETAGILTTAIAPIVTAYFANRPKQSNSINDLKAMLELTGQLEPSDEEKPKDLLEIAGDFLGTFQNAQKQAGTNVIEHGQPLPPQPQPQPVQTNQSNPNTKYATYSVFLDALVQLTPSEPPVDDLVNQIVGQMSEMQLNVIKQLITQDKPLAFITGYHPAFVNHVDWLNDLIAAFEDKLFTQDNNSDTQRDIDSENNNASESDADT
jgi:hypothetical protein